MQSWCPTCQRENNAEAIYCSYCGGTLPSGPPVPQGGNPNTGSTIDLGRAQQQWLPPAAPSIVPAPPVQASAKPACASGSGNGWWGWLVMGMIVFFVVPRLFIVFFEVAGVGFKLWWLFPLFFVLVGSRRRHRRSRHSNRHRNNGPWVVLLLLGIAVTILA